MRLISWNLNGRRAKAADQIAALLRRNPDVVALQEVTRSSLPVLRDALNGGGLQEMADSFSLAPAKYQAKGPRRYGQITASRHPITAQPPERFQVSWTERVLSVHLRIGRREVELHNVHVPPGSSNKWKKIEVLKGIFTTLAVHATTPRILCGDFNTPQAELPTGEVVTWAQRLTADGSWQDMRTLRGGLGSDWKAGELGVLTGLAEYDLPDVYRLLHGYTVEEASWILRRKGTEVGRRFDHIFASRGLVPLTCEYLHDLRSSGLSDHSPIEATFGFPE